MENRGGLVFLTKKKQASCNINQCISVKVKLIATCDFDIKIYINRKQISCLIQKYKNEMWQRILKNSKFSLFSKPKI